MVSPARLGPLEGGERAGRAPRRAVRGRALALAVACAAFALGLASTSSAQHAPQASPAAGAVNAYRVAARARAALALLQAGDRPSAATQLDKAQQGPLEQVGGAVQTQMAAALARLRSALTRNDTRAARAAEADVGDAARQAADGEHATALVAALVREAGGEGQEAATSAPDGATEPRAYALALAGIAGELAARNGLPAIGRDAISTLATSIRTHADADAVAAAASAALTALGAPPSSQDVRRAFDAIDGDLAQAVARYRQGDARAADDALIDAYLNHFESLEPALRKVDAELETHLETTLAHDLRGLIHDGASPDRFASAVDDARGRLATAREALR